VPSDLAGDYFAALKKLGSLVCAVIDETWDRDFLVCALAAVAVSKGFALVGEAIQELHDPIAEALLKGIRGHVQRFHPNPSKTCPEPSRGGSAVAPDRVNP
jgi:hypothetical protein